MKYEFIFKVKESRSDHFKVKYRCVCEPERYDSVLFAYNKIDKNQFFDSVILINKLDDNGEFIEVVQ